MLTLASLLGDGLDCRIDVRGEDQIKRGSCPPGFGPLATMYEGPVYGELSGKVLSLQLSSYSGANGVFIRNRDKMVTLGVAARGAFIVSDQFAGCDLTILRNPAGQILGAHVYSNAMCRACIANLPKGWRVIGTWRSAGYQAKWKTTALFAFALIESDVVWVVAVGSKGHPLKITNVDPVGPFPL